MTPEQETANKKRYAEILIRTPDPFVAALELFPDNTTWSAWIAKHWPKNPEVIAFKKDLVGSGFGADELPTKDDLSRAIWDKMNGPILPDDFAKLAKVYAEVNKMIEKPSTTVSVTPQIIIPKVIEIPNFGSAEEWEAKVEKQQKDLLSVSRSKS